ncbi:MAG: MBL fold metallo-hydrolase [Candidatus Tectomicrobia bacterium]|uniref:MBL fold metallo-hydrolase n=1 Tax=Tectimicrobiota bacterium TaxID=2528274 RepID=A0A932CN12_UNCTE|nr:MBL fold metallo-hydrolase [Candidatus Tectomicrobia bacterium]
MRKKVLLGLILSACLLSSPWPGMASAQNLEILQVKDGIYAAIGKPGRVVGANAAILLNEKGVLVVDTHISPKAAEELASEIKKLTEKPITEVINTHFHFDHTDGNQVFFPQALIIGHRDTREILLRSGLEKVEAFRKRRATQLAEERKRLASAHLDPAEREKAEGQIKFWEDFVKTVEEMKPTLKITPPNLTLDRTLTLYKGDREIQVSFFGRGHTSGDVVVYLPREKVLCSGDLLVSSGLPYMGDGFPSHWDATLAQIERLDFDTLIPGHGPVVKGPEAKEMVKTFRRYLRDLVRQVGGFVRKGASLEKTLKGVTLPQYAKKFPNFQEGLPGNIERTYQELSQRAKERRK